MRMFTETNAATTNPQGRPRSPQRLSRPAGKEHSTSAAAKQASKRAILCTTGSQAARNGSRWKEAACAAAAHFTACARHFKIGGLADHVGELLQKSFQVGAVAFSSFTPSSASCAAKVCQPTASSGPNLQSSRPAAHWSCPHAFTTASPPAVVLGGAARTKCHPRESGSARGAR